MPSVAVIGAGPGGLAAAALLAAKGYNVSVFEAAQNVGGRTSQVILPDPTAQSASTSRPYSHPDSTAPAFRFDLGPTFLLMPQVLQRIFAGAGRSMDAYLRIKRIDPMYTLQFPDDTRISPFDHLDRPHNEPRFGRTQTAIEKLSTKDAQSYARYVEYMERKLEAILPVLSLPYSTTRDMLDRSLLGAAPYLKPHRSLASELRSFFKDERVQLSFGFQAKYLGMSPEECPSLFSILNFIEQKYGVWHVEGGLGKITQALAQLVRDVGGKIVTGAPVTKVHSKPFGSKSRTITSIEVDGYGMQFDRYVVGADFANFMRTAVPEDAREHARYSDRKLSSMKYSCSTFMLYLGLDREFELPHHTVLFSRDYKKYLQEIGSKRHAQLPLDPSVYICNPAATDKTMAPRGKSGLYIPSPVANLQMGGVDWEREAETYRSIVLMKIRERLGPDLEPHILTERVITPLDWQQEFRVAYGAVFNFAHSLDQLLILRPHNHSEDFENLYVVGGGTHPGSGLPTTLQSAQISTNLILRRDGVTNRRAAETALKALAEDAHQWYAYLPD